MGLDMYLYEISKPDGIKDGDFIVFGPESRGLPAQYVTSESALTIPMKEGQRSLNLSNSVAIVAYEAIRQLGL